MAASVCVCHSLPFPNSSAKSWNWNWKAKATPLSPLKAGAPDKTEAPDGQAMTLDNLHRFIHLNLGKWTGSFHQFDGNGNLLQKVNTKLSVGSYGEDDLISLIQTLYIEQPSSKTLISGYDQQPEWAEYKIKETNMFTVDKYQQIGFFPENRAFSLRYQTAGMLETVLRLGVLGEDDTGEASPKNLKLPSHRPSIVCENCLYSQVKDRRARAFHIMDPKGFLDTLLLFLEDRGDGLLPPPSLGGAMDAKERILPFIGKWKGCSVTKRSGVYGTTIAEADITTLLEMDDKYQLILDVTSRGGAHDDDTTNVHWSGKIRDNLIVFGGGYEMTLLPGGVYMGYPSDVAKSVGESKSFHLEFCWLEGPDWRQRLVRTYDAEGLVVSTTYISESRM